MASLHKHRDWCSWHALEGIGCFEVTSKRLHHPELGSKNHAVRWARHVRLHERLIHTLPELIGTVFSPLAVRALVERVIKQAADSEGIPAPLLHVEVLYAYGTAVIEFYGGKNVYIRFPEVHSVCASGYENVRGEPQER